MLSPGHVAFEHLDQVGRYCSQLKGARQLGAEFDAGWSVFTQELLRGIGKERRESGTIELGANAQECFEGARSCLWLLQNGLEGIADARLVGELRQTK